MLVVLSEINCLNYLRGRGVHPDEFYTDIDVLKHNAIVFKNATLVVILAGNGRFSKRSTIELVKILQKRASEEIDTGISHVYVVSDITIPNLDIYYKYEGSANTVSIMRGWNVVKANVDLWEKLQNDYRDTKLFLSDFDKGITDSALEAFNSRVENEDKYIPLIQKVNVKELLGID